ncbi:MAG: hypothetical protein H8E82_05900 [Candidatus Marinimicrobia bacterium]|nr:hypothetical protein [Candidatus Neomarinimicrobiota bacterium]MBL7047031.1 hypothetical protein [Candidatus Neomarinimicrobiota bacterium]
MSIISQLVQLQNVDSKLMELENLQGNLPAKVEHLSDEQNRLNISVSTKEERLQEIQLETRKLEGIVADNEVKLKKLQDQLYIVKTNREYDALMTEIDHLKLTIDDAEIRELELSEEKDRIEEELKIDTLKLEEISEELAIQKEMLEKTIASTDKEKQEFMSQRETIIPNIEPRYLSIYNRVRQARDGLAVVNVVNRVCGGCHARLTSQMISEIRSGTIVHTCPACRRFLYWDPDTLRYRAGEE